MSNLKFSIVIPYQQRRENIRSVFAALADQTMDGGEFEVIVGALEQSDELAAARSEFTDRLTINSVRSNPDENVAHARNVAMRQTSGQVIVVLDTDIAVTNQTLQTLYDGYFADQQNICVLGRMLGHLDSAPMPWALGDWSLAALPAATIREHDLIFDTGFHEGKSRDQEWGYRIHAAGIPIVVGENVNPVHLANLSDTRRFLSKWPTLEVELSLVFGGEAANRLHSEVTRESAAIVDRPDQTLGVIRGKAGGTDLLVLGAYVDPDGIADDEALVLFDDGSALEVLPLVGLALPYPDNSVEECRVLPAIMELSDRYRHAVVREAHRVATRAVTPRPDGV
ncbi:MAG TPA: hypothetical protein DGG94_10260 [Micromonosporaceae bacterium]|nr:hypothetical protein [Micromonosporaceae bacterium]HCU50165.1 hypothetical protein [Micromonosporaceae bacterium]